ncbi:hypothetical protein GCM10009753_38470 [Streptantibioticus ferralitis]
MGRRSRIHCKAGNLTAVTASNPDNAAAAASSPPQRQKGAAAAANNPPQRGPAVATRRTP